MTDYVMLGLTKRRAELTGKIEKTHKDLRRMLINLESLDETIVQLDPSFKVETTNPKRSGHPRTGQTEAR